MLIIVHFPQARIPRHHPRFLSKFSTTLVSRIHLFFPGKHHYTVGQRREGESPGCGDISQAPSGCYRKDWMQRAQCSAWHKSCNKLQLSAPFLRLLNLLSTWTSSCPWLQMSCSLAHAPITNPLLPRSAYIPFVHVKDHFSFHPYKSHCLLRWLIQLDWKRGLARPP